MAAPETGKELKEMEKPTEEKDIITLDSSRKLEEVLAENPLAIVSVQIEFNRKSDPPGQGGEEDS